MGFCDSCVGFMCTNNTSGLPKIPAASNVLAPSATLGYVVSSEAVSDLALAVAPSSPKAGLDRVEGRTGVDSIRLVPSSTSITMRSLTCVRQDRRCRQHSAVPQLHALRTSAKRQPGSSTTSTLELAPNKQSQQPPDPTHKTGRFTPSVFLSVTIRQRRRVSYSP